MLLGLFQCFLRNRLLLLKDINERLHLKENVQLTFFFVYVAASRCISISFIERTAGALEKILTTASERKECATVFRIMST